jgi:hypothetical protein
MEATGVRYMVGDIRRIDADLLAKVDEELAAGTL